MSFIDSLSQLCSIILCILVVLLFHLLHRIYHSYKRYSFYSSQGIRGHPFSPLIGNSLTLYHEMKNDRGLQPLHDYHRKYGDIHLNYIGPTLYLSINSPPYIHQIYKLNDNYWRKSDATISALEILLERPKEISAEFSLFFQSYNAHTRSRKLQAPFFHYSSLAKLHQSMQIETNQAIGELRTSLALDNCPIIDLQAWFQSLTLNIILSSAFSSSLHSRPDIKSTLMKAMNSGLKACFLRLLSPIEFIPFINQLPIYYKPDIDNARSLLFSTVREIIKYRCTNAIDSSNEDMLDLLLHVRDSEGPLSTTQIEHDSLFYFFAGHETLTSTLTWTMLELFQHQDAMTDLLEEIQSLNLHPVVSSEMDIQLDLSQLSQLKICEAIVLESIRLHPPIPNLSKECIQSHTIEVEGHSPLHITAGTQILVRPCIVNRLTEYWGEDANIWDYTRWLRKSNVSTPTNGSVPYSHSASFLSFSYGGRDCLGKNFALIEAKTILTLLLHQFQFELIPGQTIIEQLTASLRAKYGIKAHVQEKR